MLKGHEVLGTDLPIYRRMSDDHFTIEEIWHLNHDMNDFEKVGYASYVEFNQIFFKPVYAYKKEISLNS